MRLTAPIKYFPLFALAVVLCFFTGCHTRKTDLAHLQSLDSLMLASPNDVLDSLSKIEESSLSSGLRPYYLLLKVISSDRSRIYATSDSAINLAVKGLESDRNSYNYARALLYQGVVRYRMNIQDSTTIMPIRKSIDIFLHLPEPNDDMLHVAYYYLAEIHYKSDNLALEYKYRLKSLEYAKQANDSLRMLNVYLDLCYNRMNSNRFDQARLYLDSAERIKMGGSAFDEYKVNTSAVYFTRTKQYEKALSAHRKLFYIDMQSNDRKNFTVDCSNLSAAYKDLARYDSALIYAIKAVNYIQDTTNTINHYYYNKVAEIAGLVGNLRIANQYHRESYIQLNRSIKRQTDTQVLEAEKRYDKSQAELKASQLVHHNRMLYGIVGLAVLLLLVFYLYARQRKLQQAHRITMMEQERLLIEQEQLKLRQSLIEKEYTERMILRDNDEKKMMVDLFQLISNRYAVTQRKLQMFSDRLILEYPDIYDHLQKELSSVQKDFQILDKHFVSDEIFLRITGIEPQSCPLSETEKALLFLVACNATNKQIALLLGTTMGSVRVRRLNLRTKIEKFGIYAPEVIKEVE